MNKTVSLASMLTSIWPEKKEIGLSVSGDCLEIVAEHSVMKHHAIEDLGIKINGMDVVENGYATRITDTEEVVIITLPFEPQAGDVIVVDTEVQRFGSKKITLKVE